MNKSFLYKKIVLYFLILVWIFIAFFNVVYNSIKTVSEIREWAPLSDSQKRQKMFGDSYDFSVFINAYTEPHAKILLFSDTSMPYFYARYYSYPRHLYWFENTEEYVKRTYPKQFDYVAIYNLHTSLNGYKRVASFSEKQSGVFGGIYIKK